MKRKGLAATATTTAAATAAAAAAATTTTTTTTAAATMTLRVSVFKNRRSSHLCYTCCLFRKSD